MRTQYLEGARRLRAWLDTTGLLPGTQLPSSPKLAKQFQINPATMLRAQQVLVSGGRLRRDGYRLYVATPPRAPALLGQIHIVTFHEEARLAERILHQRGVDCLLHSLTWDVDPESFIKHQVLPKKPAGILFWTSDPNESCLQLLQNIGLPVVMCADVPFALPVSTGSIDIKSGVVIALKYLKDLGHRQIAHVVCDRSTYANHMADCYREACLTLGLESAAALVWESENVAPAVMRHTLKEGKKNHPEVTAIFGDDRVGIEASKLFDLPRNVSFVGFFNLPEAMETRPPLTTVAILNHESMAHWAANEMVSRVERAASGRPWLPPSHIRFLPELIVRKSARRLRRSSDRMSPPSRVASRRFESADTWNTVYPFLRRVRHPAWLNIDLSASVNHSMTHRNGWLGSDPLEHFPPGLRSIHGVPFQVLDERQHQGRAVITFRSPHSHSAKAQELPTRLRIKVKARARAVYFLHGCGHALPRAFACYRLLLSNGKAIETKLVPTGPSLRLATLALGGNSPNLQDWWPDFEHLNFAHAYRAAVQDPRNQVRSTRYLYSLEMINQQPKQEIEAIEIEVDPLAGPTLAILAITALL